MARLATSIQQASHDLGRATEALCAAVIEQCGRTTEAHELELLVNSVIMLRNLSRQLEEVASRAQRLADSQVMEGD
jgi:hypothetical protein